MSSYKNNVIPFPGSCRTKLSASSVTRRARVQTRDKQVELAEKLGTTSRSIRRSEYGESSLTLEMILRDHAFAKAVAQEILRALGETTENNGNQAEKEAA